MKSEEIKQKLLEANYTNIAAANRISKLVCENERLRFMLYRSVKLHGGTFDVHVLADSEMEMVKSANIFMAPDDSEIKFIAEEKDK